MTDTVSAKPDKSCSFHSSFFEFASQVLAMYRGWTQLQGAFSFQTTLDSDFKCISGWNRFKNKTLGVS